MEIDDRYFSGVWYDGQAADFTKVIETDDAAALVTPKYGDIHYEWDDPETAQAELERDFTKVAKKAVERPAEYYTEMVDTLLEHSRRAGGELSFQEDISFEWARRQINVVEE